MSTQQDIYAAGSENHPPMLNKENYVLWPSCLLRYAKSRPNGKLIHNSISLNSPLALAIGFWMDTNKAETAEVKEVIKVVTTAKLMTEVVTTAATPITAAQVPKASASRRRRDQVKRKEKQDNTVMRYQALKRKPVTEAQGRKNMMVYLKNIAGFKMDFFRGMTYTDIKPIFKKHYNSIQAFLDKGEEEIIEQEEGSKRKSESSKQRAAKKQRIDEEEEELKRHLQIVVNDYDDDVFTKATPLALKMFLLVEKKYPLTRFTLEQMLNNVRMKVEEESEMSLKLLRMDNPNITMEEYIRLEEEKACRRGKVYNWETAKYGKIWYDEDIHDLRSVEIKFPAIVFNDGLSFEKTLSYEPMVEDVSKLFTLVYILLAAVFSPTAVTSMTFHSLLQLPSLHYSTFVPE
nr:ribonuclease H-like domain-containing protein [Tanacetum cinerariifolium]